MKILLFAGLLMMVLGIASLLVPVPHSETQGIKIGDTNIGVQTASGRRVRRKPAEAIAISRAGLKLAAVYQNRQNRPEDFPKPRAQPPEATLMTTRRTSSCSRQGRPSISPRIDPSDAVVKNNIVPVFVGVKKAFKAAAGANAPAYKIGVYGWVARAACCARAILSTSTWLCQSTGFAQHDKYLKSMDWNLEQNMPEIVCGMKCDRTRPIPTTRSSVLSCSTWALLVRPSPASRRSPYTANPGSSRPGVARQGRSGFELRGELGVAVARR